MTSSTFHNCGGQSATQTGGCDNDSVENGCSAGLSVFKILTHSNQFNPKIMQATCKQQITFCLIIVGVELQTQNNTHPPPAGHKIG